MASALTWGACAVLVVSVGLVLGVSMLSGLRNTAELVSAKAVLIVDSISERTREHLRPAMAQTAYLARLVVDGDLGLEDREQLFRSLAASIAAAPQLGGTGFIAPDGQMLAVQRTAQGAVVRMTGPSASSLKDENFGRRREGHWGEIFRSPSDDSVVVNYRYPVWQGDRFLGVFAAGVSTRQIDSFLHTIATPHGATAFILRGRDEVLASSSLAGSTAPPRSDVHLPRVGAVRDPVLRRIWDADTRVVRAPVPEGYQVRVVESAQASHIIVYRSLAEIENVPLIVGCHFPQTTLGGEFKRLERAVMIALTITLVAVVITFVAGRRIARPVLRLARAADAVRAGGASAAFTLPPSRLRELDAASGAFNEMVKGLEERELIRDTFGRFVPESIADQILADRGALAPQTRMCTTLFTDVAGFSTVSESMSPVDLIALLNEYFAAVVAPIDANGGVIHQFQGDAILATFNLPVEHVDHAARALRAALQIQQATVGRTFGNGVSMATRVGINTGLAVCGTVGTSGRLGFTVHGDEVNLAARIEQMNKELGTWVLAARSTVQLAGDGFVFTPMGELPVRGRRSGVEVYRVDGER